MPGWRDSCWCTGQRVDRHVMLTGSSTVPCPIVAPALPCSATVHCAGMRGAKQLVSDDGHAGGWAMLPHQQQLLEHGCAHLVIDVPFEADRDAILVRDDQRRRVVPAVALGVHQLRQEVHQGDELEPARNDRD